MLVHHITEHLETINPLCSFPLMFPPLCFSPSSSFFPRPPLLSSPLLSSPPPRLSSPPSSLSSLLPPPSSLSLNLLLDPIDLTKEDDALQKALALSLQEMQQQPDSGGISLEDQELSRCV